MREAIEAASREALKSPMGHRHGAVLMHRGKVVASGYNYLLASPREFEGRPHPGVHAEACAVFAARSRRVWGDTLLVVRVNSQGMLRLSRPCLRCLALLKKKGMRRVLFSNNQGGIESLLL